MEARLLRVTVLLLAVSSIGANYGVRRGPPAAMAGQFASQNFHVTAATPEFARQVCEAAERFRRDLALEWLGRTLPPWNSPCVMRVQTGPRLGAGGATSFAFDRGRPVDFRMTIQGSRERVLDSVLPHEVTHMVMATHFGCKLPRWADEGAATMVEHASERAKHDKLLIRFLTTEKGIPFNEMFAMQEYPRDILPLYAQGYSVARFLVAQGGKRRYVRYVGDGLRWRNWTAATQTHYGFASLSELQESWLDWVREGSPDSVAGRQVPGSALADSRAGTVVQPVSTSRHPRAFDGMVPLPDSVSNQAHAARPNSGASRSMSGAPTTDSAAGDSWYRRQRDRRGPASRSGVAGQRAGGQQTSQQLTRPQPLGRPGQVVLEWGRGNPGVKRR